jgi:hypothetical protein
MIGVLILFYLHCMYGCLFLDAWMWSLDAIDGTQFVSAEETFAEDPEQQLYIEQGKYNMRFRPKHH